MKFKQALNITVLKASVTIYLNHMRILIISLILLSFAFRSLAQIQGTFSNYYGEKGNSNSPFRLVEIHYINAAKIYFYLETGKGAPSYNSGAIYGKLTFNKTSGNFEYLPKDTMESCRLVFFNTAIK